MKVSALQNTILFNVAETFTSGHVISFKHHQTEVTLYDFLLGVVGGDFKNLAFNFADSLWQLDRFFCGGGCFCLLAASRQETSSKWDLHTRTFRSKMRFSLDNTCVVFPPCIEISLSRSEIGMMIKFIIKSKLTMFQNWAYFRTCDPENKVFT